MIPYLAVFIEALARVFGELLFLAGELSVQVAGPLVPSSIASIVYVYIHV